MRFNIGDKVRVLDGSNIDDYYRGWAPGMVKYVGSVSRVEGIDGKGYTLSCDRGSPAQYTWDERGLEKVDENEPRFKVGDPVRVICGKGIESNSIPWMKGMEKLIGRDVHIKVVSSVGGKGRTAFTYKVTNDPSMLGWWLDENWLVPASEYHSPLYALKESREDVCDKSDKREEFCIGDRVRVARINPIYGSDGTKTPYVGAVGCIDGKGVFGYKVNGLPSSWHPDELMKVDPRTRTPKYKVGDRVMVLDGRDDKESHVYWVDGDGMTKCIGRVCTIQEVCAHIGYVSYRFADKVSPWCFDERWLIPENQERPADDKVPSDPQDEPATIHFLPFERG